MRDWSSSSAQIGVFTDRQIQILEALRRPGKHSCGALSDYLGFRVDGYDLETVQTLLIEKRGEERLKRARAGRFIHWWIEQKSD